MNLWGNFASKFWFWSNLGKFCSRTINLETCAHRLSRGCRRSPCPATRTDAAPANPVLRKPSSSFLSERRTAAVDTKRVSPLPYSGASSGETPAATASRQGSVERARNFRMDVDFLKLTCHSAQLRLQSDQTAGDRLAVSVTEHWRLTVFVMSFHSPVSPPTRHRRLGYVFTPNSAHQPTQPVSAPHVANEEPNQEHAGAGQQSGPTCTAVGLSVRPSLSWLDSGRVASQVRNTIGGIALSAAAPEAAAANSGASSWQWPHHGAKKSSSTYGFTLCSDQLSSCRPATTRHMHTSIGPASRTHAGRGQAAGAGCHEQLQARRCWPRTVTSRTGVPSAIFRMSAVASAPRHTLCGHLPVNSMNALAKAICPARPPATCAIAVPPIGQSMPSFPRPSASQSFSSVAAAAGPSTLRKPIHQPPQQQRQQQCGSSAGQATHAANFPWT